MNKGRFLKFLMLLAASALVLAGCDLLSLAADVTPPPDYTPPVPVAQTEVRSTAFPLLPPDPAEGAAIFAEKCAPCHGPTGLSDGERTNQLPSMPPMIGSAKVSVDAVPSDWYQIISDGNLERLMPGFSGSLDERQRWNVTAYALSLGMNTQQVEMGAELYRQQCADCHDAEPGGQSDLTNLRAMMLYSVTDIADLIQNGIGAMPPMTQLDETQRLALAQYVRSLSFQQDEAETAGSQPAAETASPAEGLQTPQAPEQGTPLATLAESESTGEKLVIRGRILPAEGSIPIADLPVQLTEYQGMTAVGEQSARSTLDGSFEFQVQGSSEAVYIASVKRDGLTFSSDILHAADLLNGTADLTIPVFNTTSNPTTLSADRMHVFLDFSQGGTLQVVELFILSNTGNSVVVPAQDAPALVFSLPRGALNLNFDAGQLGGRFVLLDGGFGDLSPVYPGSGTHQVLYSYSLPFDQTLALQLELPFPVSAAVVMLPAGGIRLESAQLVDSGERQVEGMVYNVYTGGNLTDRLDLTLSGRPGAGSASDPGQLTGLLIGGGFLGLVLVAVGFLLFRAKPAQRGIPEASQPKPASKDSEESLLDALLDLEDRYKSGKLKEATYQRERKGLVERLNRLRVQK